jgi:hypothetical protein
VPQAIVWLVAAAWTALSLALDISGLFPRVPWNLLALVGFSVFVAATYVTLTRLETQLRTRWT